MSASSRASAVSLIGLALVAAVLAAAYHSGWKPRLPGFLKDGPKDGVAARGPVAAAQKPATVSGVIKIDDDDQERGGIEAAAPKEIVFQEQVRAYGIVLALDRLVALYNSAITAGQQLKAAEVKLAASRIATARAQKLIKVFPNTASQADTAQAAEGIDKAAVEAATAQLETIRNSAVQEWGPVLGTAIATRSELMQNLLARKTCLVQLTLQPGAQIAAPQRAAVTLARGEAATADLISPATQADPRIAGASYFYALPVSANTLTGGTVSASLPKGEARPSVVIPPSAVVWLGGRAWLYVKTGKETFERKPIDSDAIAAADGGYVLPAERWANALPIVVAGAQALLSEETKSQRSDEDND